MSTPAAPTTTLEEIPVESIDIIAGTNPRVIDPTAEDFLALIASIERRGVLQPIVVVEGPNAYNLVAGERRLTAARELGYERIPAIIRPTGDELEVALEENVHRHDLTPVEEAIQYQRLVDAGHSPAQVAELLSVSPKRVTARLGLLQLQPEMQRAVSTGSVPLRTVPHLVRLTEQAPAIATAVQSAILEGREESWRARDDDDPITVAVEEFLDDEGDFIASIDGAGIYIPKHRGIRLTGKEEWLDEKSRELVNEMNKAARADWERYDFVIPEAQLDALAQPGSGALTFRSSYNDQITSVAFDTPDWLIENAAPIIAADHKKWKTEKNRAAKAGAPGTIAANDDDAEARKAQLEADRAHAKACAAANTDLGIKLIKGLWTVELDMDVATFFAYTVLSTNSLGGLAARGLGYVLPEWQTVVEMKTKTKVAYPTPSDAEELFWKWFETASTPQEILGRVVIAIAAAKYALSDAVPKGQQTWYYEHALPQRDEALEQLVKKHLPPSLIALSKGA